MEQLRHDLTAMSLQLESIKLEKTFVEDEVRTLRNEQQKSSSHNEESPNTQEIEEIRNRIREQESLLSESSRSVQRPEDNGEPQGIIREQQDSGHQLPKKNANVQPEAMGLQLTESPCSLSSAESRTREKSTLTILQARLEEEQSRSVEIEQGIVQLLKDMEMCATTMDVGATEDRAAAAKQLRLEKMNMEENLRRSREAVDAITNEIARICPGYRPQEMCDVRFVTGFEATEPTNPATPVKKSISADQ